MSSSVGASSYASVSVPDNVAEQAGLGYGIAIAVGILVLVSSIMLSSYVCVRAHARARLQNQTHHDDEEEQRQQESFHYDENQVDLEWHSLPSARSSSRSEAPGHVSGLDEKTINSYPKMVLSSAKKRLCMSTCSICLGDYMKKEVLRMLPECRHYFHATCIDAWLKLNASCPLCRHSPLSTPLLELIPLTRQPF